MLLRILLITISILTASFGAWAQPSGTAMLDEAEALALDAKLYAEAYGVPLDEAARRLLVMTGADDQIAAINANNDPALLGVYFDNGATFKLGIRAKGSKQRYSSKLVREPKDARGKKLTKAERDKARGARKAAAQARRETRKAIRAQARLADSEVEAVEAVLDEVIETPITLINDTGFSRAELEAHLAAKRVELESAIGPIEFMGVDERTGGALLYLRSTDADIEAAAERILAVQVSVFEIPEGKRSSAVRGGSLINLRIDDSGHCMTGFAARRTTTGGLGILTAGHCIGPELVYVDIDGTRRNISATPGMVKNDSSGDIAFLADTTAVAEFYADTTTTPRNLTTAKSRLSTVVGSFLCHLGQTSATNAIRIQSCGEVISISATRGADPGGAGFQGPNFGNTFIDLKGVYSNTKRKYTLLCIPGDSGGPVFANNTGYGLVQACSGTSGTVSTILTYTSLDATSLIGAQLVFK